MRFLVPAALLTPLAFGLTLGGCGSDADSSPKKGQISSPQSVCDALPAPAAGEGFTFDEGTLTLNPGQEGLFCKQMAVPEAFSGADHYITGLDASVSHGTHHLIVTFSDEALSTTPALCKDTGSGQVKSGGANFQDFAVNPNPLSVIETLRRVAFGGGGGSASIRFPKGYGKPMPLGFFESSHHVLNLKTTTEDICGRFNIYAAKAEEIEHPLGVLYANALHVNVPANSPGSLEATMTAPEAMDLVVFMSHAHNYLTRFEMFLYKDGKTAAEPFYVSDNWEEPRVLVQDPPLHLAAGDGVTFRCSYQNTRNETLKWGVVGGEMCMPFALYADPAGSPRRVPPALSVAMADPTPAVLKVGNSGFGE